MMLNYELKIYSMKIDHPNILKFYEHFEDKKNHYLVIEKVKGLDLDELIKEEDHDFWDNRELRAQ